VQSSVQSSVTFSGIGLHSGAPVVLVVHPAPADHGIVFRRSDVTGRDALIPALWDRVIVSPLNTRIENADGVHVSTIEHLMAALAGLGIGNALITLDGPEVPIMDGSAAPFVRGLLAAGLQQLSAPVRALRLRRAVEVRDGDALARLDPATTLQIDFAIDFPDTAIGQDRRVMNMANGTFVRELCDCRTFCRQSDVERMHAQGLALGGSLDNAVVVDGDRVLTPGGLRRPDEPVRHKMLDALGDLATAGLPILGRYTGHKAGHALTNRLLRALFADPAAYAIISCDARTQARLPGAGVGPQDLSAVA
jgi:UDP-3-O-[3-hydroxymyristoyl] N-acetylglucosamine deacetylase